MPRSRPGSAKHRRKKRILDAARGYRLGRSKLLRTAKDAIRKAGVNARIGRRLRKREFRSLWIVRITAACRAHGIRSAEFACGLKRANIALNRKMLSELAIHDPAAFEVLLERASQAAKAAAA